MPIKILMSNPRQSGRPIVRPNTVSAQKSAMRFIYLPSSFLSILTNRICYKPSFLSYYGVQCVYVGLLFALDISDIFIFMVQLIRPEIATFPAAWFGARPRASKCNVLRFLITRRHEPQCTLRKGLNGISPNLQTHI